MKERDSFNSKLGIVAAAAGSAIRLGNIWKFPYMAGINGGGAFILIYIIATILMGYPLIYTELAIGRNTKVNAINAGMDTATHFADIFTNMNNNVTMPIIYAIIAVCLTGFINVAGIKNGIEKYSKILMPILFVLFLILIGYSTTLPGFKEAAVFLFKPNFSEITPSVIIAAIGQAFFSLSLGMGLLITYGSYIQNDVNLHSVSKQIIVADTVIALFSGLLIFPAVFSYNMAPDAGPSLLFQSLPQVFYQMPGGRWFGAIFFLLVLVAAITSLISMAEILITVISEKLHLSRKVSTIVVVVVSILGSIVTILGEGPLKSFTIGGQTIFGALDYLTNNITIPLVGALTAIIALWIWKGINLKKELSSDGTFTSKTDGFFQLLLKWIIPPVIIVLMITSL